MLSCVRDFGWLLVNYRLEVHLLFAFRLLATATHSFGNSHLASHRRPHTMLPTHCPRPSHPPADELALAVLEVASLFPAGGQVLLQPWINNCLLLCHQGVAQEPPDFSQNFGDQ
ncbi:hypothetical protein VPH35_007490 [Triticum aestivum]